MCTRATAPLCVYPCFCYRSCRRRSCQCGLHKQAARAKVARSSAQPKGLRSASRRQSRRSCSASRPGRRARSRPHRTARRRPVRLAPRSGSPAGGSASAATGASVPLSPSAPLQARYGLRPPRSFRGLRKPPPGSCSAGGEKNERNEPSMHVNQRFCTFVREYADNLPAPRAKRRPAFQSVSCREEHPHRYPLSTSSIIAYLTASMLWSLPSGMSSSHVPSRSRSYSLRRNSS